MPTYDYQCATCGAKFEYFQSMTEPPLERCTAEVCRADGMAGKGELQRLISSGAGLVFKGSGFYITDYKKGSSSSPPQAASGPRPETGSAPKSDAPSAPPPPTKETPASPKAPADS